MPILSKRGVCVCKISRFIWEQSASGLLRNLGLKTSLSKIPTGWYFTLKVQNE